MAATLRAPAVGYSRGMVIGMCVIGCLATASILLTLLRPSAAPVTAPPIRVVSTSNQQPAPEPPATEVVPPAADPTNLGGQAKAKVDRTKRPGPDAQGLTLALRRQQTKLEGCFKQHSVELEGQPTMQLEFDVEASGAIKRVGISPRALTGTALGECLLAIGQRTKFPEQPKAVSFAIPLTARRAP